MNVGTITATITFGSVGSNATPTQNEAMRYLIDRIVVEDMGYVSSCWIGQGSIKANGYGQIGKRLVVDAYAKGAHRASKMMLQGWEPIDSAEHIRHQCHVRACINPWHSLTGSALDNFLDRLDTPGYGRVFTDDDIRLIRKLRVKEPYRPRPRINRIAAHYGVHRSTIDRILSRKLWGHVV